MPGGAPLATYIGCLLACFIYLRSWLLLSSPDAPASPGLHVTWLGAREPRYDTGPIGARGATPDKHVRHEKKSPRAQIEVGVELQTWAVKLQLTATP
jgi:hypothetical protein